MDDSEVIFDLPADLFDSKLPNSYMLKYYEGLNHRILWINEEITKETTQELVHYIIKWNREDKDIPEMDRVPIKILFDSQGGDLDA